MDRKANLLIRKWLELELCNGLGTYGHLMCNPQKRFVIGQEYF